MTCRSCWYWKAGNKADNEPYAVKSECRVNPPSHEGWPVTRFDDWCGKGMSSGFMVRHTPERCRVLACAGRS